MKFIIEYQEFTHAQSCRLALGHARLLGRLNKCLVFVLQDGDPAKRLYALFSYLLMILAAPLYFWMIGRR